MNRRTGRTPGTTDLPEARVPRRVSCSELPPAATTPPETLSARSALPGFTPALLDMAYDALCKSRRRWPADADIWHLRFHWRAERPRILGLLQAGDWQLSPLQVIRKADGTRCAVWSACDALVIRCLTLLLTPVLPVSRLCTHVKGHGGGKRGLHDITRLVRAGRYPWVCRTDIRGYYGRIDKHLLYQQLERHVRSPVLLNLLWQFLHYSVEDGGTFHTPDRGIPRGASLSPLLAAFHLYETDALFDKPPQSPIRYVRYMDDFLIFTRTRWQLRRAVRTLNARLAAAGFKLHPGKTFIGRVSKGFDWMGFWFNDAGCTSIAPRAIDNCLTTLRRLYEQTRHQPAEVQAGRVAKYLNRWRAWARLGIPHRPSEVPGSEGVDGAMAILRGLADTPL